MAIAIAIVTMAVYKVQSRVARVRPRLALLSLVLGRRSSPLGLGYFVAVPVAVAVPLTLVVPVSGSSNNY